MRRPSLPVFLPRAGYRGRRLADAVRALPALGGFLVLLPILWRPEEAARRGTAGDWLYLFGVWALLILLAAALSRALAAPGQAEAAPPPAAPGDG